MKLPGQTVYSKALILFVALSLLLGTAVVLLTQAILMREFEQTERRGMGATLQRFNVVLSRELQPLKSLLSEWAHTKKLDAEDLPTPQMLSDRQIDFFAVLNEKKEVVVLSCSNLEASRLVRASPQELAFFLSDSPDESPLRRPGFILLSNQLVAVTWLPVKTPGQPVRYWLLGKIFRGSSWDFLVGLFSASSITFEPLRGVRTGDEGSESLLAMLTKHEYIIEESGNDLVGRTLIRGINGQPLGTIKLVQQRPLFREGARAVQIFLTVLTLAGGALFIMVWFLLDRTILARIRDLTQKLEKEKQSSRLPVRLDFQGDDELGHLAKSIEELAGMLEQIQHQYRAVVEDQTEIICRFDWDYHVTFANAVFQKLFGVTTNDTPTRLDRCLPAASYYTLTEHFGKLTSEAPVATIVHEITFPHGGSAWFRSTLRGNFLPAGLVGGQWVAADITLQIEAQQRMKESESRLRYLTSRLLRLQDEERRRIARELHDSTAQSLSALEMNMSLLEPMVTGPRAQRLMVETRRIAQDCCSELRNISYLLHPPLLDEVGLHFAILWFVDGFIKRTGIAVTVDLEKDFPRLERDWETALFRIIQEAMSNIYRHSRAEHAWIVLARKENSIVMKISDNGQGFPETLMGGGDEESAQMGVGLSGMKERLRQFQGTLEIENSPFGVSLVIILPLNLSV